MKKTICCLLLLAALIAFLPIPTTHTLSGPGEVLNCEKEPIGDCQLTLEIKELRSLLLHYKSQFSFQVDGRVYEKPESNHTMHRSGLTFITQTFFVEDKDIWWEGYDLVYPENHSYGAIWDWHREQFYWIDQNSGISAEDIPLDIQISKP